MKKLILFITITCSCFEISFSQPGQLDPSFGKNGIVTTDFGISTSAGYARGQQVLTQNDGSVYLIISNDQAALIARLRADGTIDSSYGYNGYSKFVPIAKGAFQSDGKIVVAGTSSGDFALARFNTDGTLDATFSGDGKLTTDFASTNDAAWSIAIQSNGKIVVAGTSAGDFAIARYNTDGSLDAEFSEDGKLKTDFATGTDRASSVAIQKDGKIVAIGTTSKSNNSNFALARYNHNGLLDKTFSGDGKQTTNFETFDVAHSVVIQNDGKIVLAGGTGKVEGPYDSYFTLARYNTNGSLDKTFSGDGVEIGGFGIASVAFSVALQPDGKLVAAGRTYSFEYDSDVFAVARYNTDGTPDSTFSEDGKQTPFFEAGQGEYGAAVAIQSNGKIIAAGTVFNDIPYLAVARFNTDGSLDKTFSGDGKLTDYIHVSDTYYNSMAIQGNGKIIAGGNSPSGIFTGYGWESRGALARYNTDGSLDKTFSKNGKETIDFTISSVALQKDAKIVVAGTYDDGYANFSSYVLRYNIDGTRDNFFEGYYQEYTFFRSVAIQRDGKIIVVSEDKITRLNPDGTLDNTFSEDGSQITDFDARSIAIQSNGKIVVAGTSSGNFTLARYNTNGTLDKTFSGDGKQTTDFGSNNDIAKAIAIQSDGKIVVVGNAGNTSHFAITRYNTDGSLDKTFSEDGKQTALTGSANAVAIQSDGKIVVGGSNGHFALARFNTNGSLDNTFGTNGTQVTKASEGGINDIAISGNKLYAAGYHQNPGRLGAVARYLLAPNKPPVVKITNPLNNAVYYAPVTINITATASDADGAINTVRFYKGSTLLKTDYTSPYTYTWSNVAAGTYYLKAIATDNFGLSTTSATVKVSVLPNKAPVVKIIAPLNNAVYTAPANINITATASDADGTIKSVKFYNGTTLLKTDSTSPYDFKWINVKAGSYSLSAKATDNRGLTASSATVKVSVTASKTTIVSSKKLPINNETDLNGSVSLKLIPNPVSHTLNIYTDGLAINKPSTISVISASGVILKTIQSNASNKVVQLDVSSLANGVYFLRVMSGQKVIHKRFVKL